MHHRKKVWLICAFGLWLVVAAYAFVRTNFHDYRIIHVHYLKDREITADEYSIAIRGEKISYIGKEKPWALHTIDGSGLVLAPGFIDTNSMGFVKKTAKLFDGVTTYLSSHGDSLGNRPRFPAYNSANTISVIPFENQLDDPAFNVIEKLDQGLAQGAFGISLSPEYNVKTTPSLVTRICKAYAGQSIPITFHLRYSTQKDELRGLTEALECAKLGNPIHILHITSTGATFHPREALKKIREAQAIGAVVTMDFYPYRSWQSYNTRARFKGDWRKKYGVDLNHVWLSGNTSKPMTPAFFEQLQAEGHPVNITVENIPQKTLDLIALETEALIGTDSAGIQSKNTHPRAAGSFTKFVNDYVDTGKIDLGRTFYRFSTLAAQKFAPFIPELALRGKIEVGYFADLVLWDRSQIKSQATYDEPGEASAGVRYAFVNGTPLVQDGKESLPRHMPGHFMRGKK